MTFSTVTRDNPWLVPLLSAIGVLATFLLGGRTPGTIGVFIVLILLVVALSVSLSKAQCQLGELRDAAPAQPSLTPAPSTDSDSYLPAEVVETTGGPVAEIAPTSEALPSEERAYLDALIAVHERRPKDVEQCLQIWLDGATSQEERVRRGHTILALRSRAGDKSAYDKLRCLYAADPGNASIVLALVTVFKGNNEQAAAADLLRDASRHAQADPNSELLAAELDIRLGLKQFDRALELSDVLLQDHTLPSQEIANIWERLPDKDKMRMASRRMRWRLPARPPITR